MNLPVHGVLVIGIVEMRAVFPAQPVERRDRQQFHIVGHTLAAKGKQLFQRARVGNHRGAGVEREALVFVHIGAAAGLVPGLEKRGLYTCGLQPDGQRDTAEAGADDGCGF